MGRLVRIDTAPGRGARLYVCGHRCHHGLTGATLTLIGAVLMVHDWHDHNRWLGDLIREAVDAGLMPSGPTRTV